MSKKFNSGYRLTLKGGPDLKRYCFLVQLCNGVDPYEIPVSELSHDVNLIPNVNMLHIAHYFVNTTNSTTMQLMCKYKGTEGHQFFTSGFVVDIGYFKLSNGNVICCGKVKHSQTLGVGVKPLFPWVLLKDNADILAGWCTCKAGCGESCSHVGAILYALEFAASKRDSLACTSRPNSWLPPSFKEVPFSEIRDIEMSSNQRRKRLRNEDEENSEELVLTRSEVPDHILTEFLHELHVSEQPSAIFRVLPQYSEEFQKKDYNLPSNFGDFFDARYCSMSLEELRVEAEEVFKTISITEEQRVKIEKLTRKQSESVLWKAIKVGRPSGSTIHSAIHTPLEAPSITVIKNICYPFSKSFESYWMKRGKRLETSIRDTYYIEMKKSHPNLMVRESGLWIPVNAPFLGASPDGFVRCDCCGVGLLEMKSVKFTYEEKYGDSNYIPPHHMDQIQLQLFCVGDTAKYCDYVVFHPLVTTIQRVYPNPAIQCPLVINGAKFFKMVILPELMGRYYSSLQELRQTQLPDETEIVCYCQKPREEPMVKCLGVKCTFTWFHARCFNLKRIPKAFRCYECSGTN